LCFFFSFSPPERDIREYFVDVLSSFITSAKFTRHELLESVAPVCASESTAATSNPATRAVELAHTLAFRTGLGAPLLATEHGHVDVELVKSYASSVFGKGNIAVLGTGISQEALTKLVEKSLGSLSATSTPSSAPTSYFGGETRVDLHGGAETVFIGFGTTGSPSAELAVLAAHLNPEPSVKWSEGSSAIASSIPKGASVQVVHLPYSDATLLGLLVQAQTAEDVKVAGKAAVAALKQAGSAKAEDIKKAIAKAKFTAASSVDSRAGLVSILGSKVRCMFHKSIECSKGVYICRCLLVLPLLLMKPYRRSIRLMHLPSLRYDMRIHMHLTGMTNFKLYRLLRRFSKRSPLTLPLVTSRPFLTQMNLGYNLCSLD
jgi:ubiquinol-cytochrome c reductase core subunit 2